MKTQAEHSSYKYAPQSIKNLAHHGTYYYVLFIRAILRNLIG